MNNVGEVYRSVIRNVIEKIRENMGNEIDSQTISQLQSKWENKLMQSGALSSSSNSFTLATTKEIVKETEGNHPPHLFSNLPSSVQKMSNSLNQFISHHNAKQNNVSGVLSFNIQGQPSPFMAAPSWQSNVDLGGGLSLNFSNSSDTQRSEVNLNDLQGVSSSEKALKRPRTSNLGQFDGTNDEEHFTDGEDDTSHTKKTFAKPNELEEKIDSDLDDEDEEPDTNNLVLCQFEKIVRVKNKRRCTLKDGIMKLNGRDFVFSKGVGECYF